MYESIYKNDELENEVSLDMSYFWYSDAKQSESILKENVARKKVVSFVKSLSCFKMEGLEVL